MNRKLIFLVNPISGTSDKSGLKEKIIKQTTAAGYPFVILDTSATGEYSHLINTIITENYTDVVVCGGDGTIRNVVAAVMTTGVNIGIIPMGSGNGLAFAARIPASVDKALHIIFNGKSSPIDAFYINGRISCMLCGLGFDAQVAHDFAKQKKRGLATYFKQTFRNFFIAPVYPFIIQDNETEIKTEAFFISIANSNQFGNNVRIAPQASLSDGMLDIVIVNKMSKIRLLYSLFLQLRIGQVVPVAEKKFHKKEVHYFQSKNLIIKNPGNAPLHIDGDPVETAEVFHIQIVEDAFRLIQPAL